MAAKQAAEKLIAGSKVAIFSKTYCPYCTKTKSLFSSLDVPGGVSVLELDNQSDGAEIQQYLLEKTGQRTVPNVFIAGKHIGGNSDVQALASSNELKKLLEA